MKVAARVGIVLAASALLHLVASAVALVVDVSLMCDADAHYT